jgi:hypothetical protein
MRACFVLVAVYLILSLSIITYPVKAQEPLNIIITPDGNVEPSTSLLERNGNTYTFKGDIYGTIWVQANSIIINGEGHTLRGNGADTGKNSEIGILLGGTDLSHRDCIGVLVKNLRIDNLPRGIYSVGGSNNSFIGNYFVHSGIELQGNANLTGDLIRHNNFVDSFVSLDYNPNGTDIITENNMVNCAILVWLAKAPVVDNNFWSNYTAKYPNAMALVDSEVWDTPYVFSTYDTFSVVDYHPLVDPVTAFSVPNFGLLHSIATSTPNPTVNTGTEPPETKSSIEKIIVAAVVILAILGICLIVDRRNLEHTGSN